MYDLPPWQYYPPSVISNRVVKLPVIYVGGKLPGKLPVTYRLLPVRMGHRALVLKGVGQSYRTNDCHYYYTVNISSI